LPSAFVAVLLRALTRARGRSRAGLQLVIQTFLACDSAASTSTLLPLPTPVPKDPTTTTSGTFTEGSSCVEKGTEVKSGTTKGKTIKGKTLYCCSSIWSKTQCPSS